MTGRFPAVVGAGAALVAVCGSLALAAHPPGAQATPPPAPLKLRIDRSGGAWQWHRAFSLAWENPGREGLAIAAVHYRLRGPDGEVAVGATRVPGAPETIQGLVVPGPPGVYTAEVWLEDDSGGTGPAATALLRFDDVRPGEVRPLLAASWIGRADFPLPIGLSRPGGVPPVSGIRGYAVSLARQPDQRPCAGTTACDEAETDLRGGVEGNTYVAPHLPEGTTYVQALAVSGSGMASARAGEAALRVDTTSPAVRLIGLPAGWTNRPVHLSAVASDAGSGMADGPGGVPPFTAISLEDGTPIVAAGATVGTTVIGEGVHRVVYYARDLAGNVDDGASGNGNPNPPPAEAFVRIDGTPPQVAFAAQDPGDPELIRAIVVDALSGADPTDGWIGVRSRGSGDPFAALPAAPAPAGELRARWSSSAYPRGEYEFRAFARDVAGNAAASSQRRGGTPMVLSNPLKDVATLRVALEAPSGGRGSTLPPGKPLRVGGRLLDASGAPLSSMPIRMVEHFAVGPPRASTATTGPDGRFAVQLTPGPSREVTASFAGTPRVAPAESEPLRLAVRSAVRLRVSSRFAKVGGAPIVFAGRVAAAAGTVPPEGKSVQLQFRLPGGPWTEFRTVQTDRRGRFRHAYRFSDDDSRGVRFTFRAFAPAQGGWPYEPAGSRPVAVRGR